ncbi:MAG TPA: protein translocase subunit SecF [Drouetiella sp.]
MSKVGVDLVKYRWLWFGISGVILIPGIVGIIMCLERFHAPLKLGIDFTGGSILQYQFEKKANLEDVRQVLDQSNLAGSQVQQAEVSGQDVVVMRTRALDDEAEKRKLDDNLKAKLGDFKVLSVDKVSATIGPELLQSGLVAMLITFAMMVGYISYRFKFDFAICAIVALVHDVVALCGIFALLGLAIGTEVDSLFISAILTVIGFSVHDTIVVFDRIRENTKHVGSKVKSTEQGEYKKTFGDVANDSVNQTLARSIYTSLTVIITLSALYLLGGTTTRDFVLAMLIGVISGTYSSIFNASCLLVLWRELRVGRKVKPA